MNIAGNKLANGFSQLSTATGEATKAFNQFSDAVGKIRRFQRIKLLIWEYKVKLFWLYRRIARKIRFNR